MADKELPRRGQGVTRTQLASNRAARLKRCFGCDNTKPIELFSRDASRSDGLQPKCKTCYAAYVSANKAKIAAQKREYAALNNDNISAGKKAYYEANKEKSHAASRAYILAHPEKRRVYSQRHRAKNGDALRQYAKDWMCANKESFREYAKKWRAENSDRCREVDRSRRQKNAERLRLKDREYRSENRDRIAAHCRNRQARKLRATPSWADFEEMARFYENAVAMTKKTGLAHHVDHIVPLKSKIVCGLHCPANLQVLVGTVNIAKGNRFWPDMP